MNQNSAADECWKRYATMEAAMLSSAVFTAEEILILKFASWILVLDKVEIR